MRVGHLLKLRVHSCVIVEYIPRSEEDGIYQTSLSELAKKRQQAQNDVQVEQGVFRIKEPPVCVDDPSRYEGGAEWGGGRKGEGGEGEAEGKKRKKE